VLSPSPDQFSFQEIRELFDQEDPGQAFDALLARAVERKTARGLTMVSRLIEQITEQIGGESPLPVGLARVLLRHSEVILRTRDVQADFFEIDNSRRLDWLFARALRTLPEEKRANELLSWLPGMDGLVFVASFAEWITSEEGNNSGDVILPADCHAQLRSEILRKIDEIANQEGLLSKPQAAPFLFAWARLSEFKRVSNWLACQIKSDSALLELAAIMPQEGRSSDEGAYYFVDVKTWSKLVDVDEVHRRVNKIAGESSHVRAKEIAERFDVALNRSRRKNRHR
jgi:hypothetical protein